MIRRGFRFKLAPSAEQEALFGQFVGVCRLVYNLALEQRRDWYRQFKNQTGRHLSYVSQARELTVLRAEFAWVSAVSTICQQQALRDLDAAFVRFFTGAADFPSPRKKGVNESFRFTGRDVHIRSLNRKWSEVWLPKIGWVKFRDSRPLRGKINNATVSLSALGWHVSFACEIEHEVPASYPAAVGIDRGIANTLSLSTGEHLSLPASLSAIDRRKRQAQRALARKTRGSKRRAKALRRVSRLSARAARIRLDWQHKTALGIAQRFGAVTMEDLNIKNMTASAKGTIAAPGRNVRQKAGLNRSILNQGWGEFQRILAYKIAERGGTLTLVGPAYTSQTCSDCGAIDRLSRESQAAFVCRHCGFRAHADHNAAINILRRNTASMGMEEGHLLSGEVLTGNGLRSVENQTSV